MSIGIDFVLRGSSAAFNKMLAGVDNGIKGLKKSLKEFDVGSGLKQALGVGGVIAGFRAIIGHARETRDELDKLGKPVDRATRSVAEFGDALSGVVGFAKDAGVTILSAFTKVGDGIRQIIQNTSQAEEDALRKMVSDTGKAADEQQKKLKASQEANSPEKVKAAQKELEQQRRMNAAKGTEDEKKLIELVNQRADILGKIKTTPKATAEAISLQASLEKNKREMSELAGKMDTDTRKTKTDFSEKKADLEKDIKKEKENLQEIKDKRNNERNDPFRKGIEEFAAQSTGGWMTIEEQQNNPVLKARKALELERQADEFAKQQKFDKSDKLREQAAGLRAGLAGKIKSSDSNVEMEYKKALKDSEEKLGEISKKLDGLIKAQK